MSSAVFPDLPGIDIKVRKSPIWSTEIQRAVSGKELRAAFFSYPLYRFQVSFEVLRSGSLGELESLIGFFNLRRGRYDNFLFTDPEDSSVTNQQFGTGDGTTAAFQLIRTYGSHNEPVMNLNGAPTIKVDGVTQATPADYSISSTGMVTFTTPPAASAVLTWSGAYYYRVRFDRDQADFERFLRQLWSAKSIDLYGSLGTKV